MSSNKIESLNMITKSTVPLAALVLAVCASAFAAEIKKIEIWDQRVAIVNTEAICKRDVEERMQGMAERLTDYKRKKTAEGMWTPETDKEWTHMYVDGFRDALRGLVRERLMLQHYAREKMSIDDKNYQRRLSDYMKRLHDMGARNIDVTDASKRVKESMMLDEFRGKFDNAMEFPKKPEVEKYYLDNIDKYQRKAGVKVRCIRIDSSVINKITGVKTVRDNPYGMLEDIRHDIVDFGASFSEVAKAKTDDLELKESGGLIVGTNKDPYIVPEDYNKVLAGAIRNLKDGEVSAIFPYGNGYAIAMIEDRREAGARMLEGKLYEEIYNEMYESKRRRKEDEWFRATLAKTLVMQIVEGNARPLSIDFFFPDDKKSADFVNAADSPDKKKKDDKKNTDIGKDGEDTAASDKKKKDKETK